MLDFCLVKLAVAPAGAKWDINAGRPGHVNITRGTVDRILTMNGLRGNY